MANKTMAAVPARDAARPAVEGVAGEVGACHERHTPVRDRRLGVQAGVLGVVQQRRRPGEQADRLAEGRERGLHVGFRGRE